MNVVPFVCLVVLVFSLTYEVSGTAEDGFMICKSGKNMFQNDPGDRSETNDNSVIPRKGKAGPKGSKGDAGERGQSGLKGEPGESAVDRVPLLEDRIACLEKTLEHLQTVLIGPVSGSYRYKVSPGTMTFEAGKSYCNSINGDMAYHEMASISRRREVSNEFFKPSQANIWIGVTKSASGSWKWLDGSDASSHMHWMDGQPNNYAGNQECCRIERNTNWKTNDIKCNEKNWVLCEIPIFEC